MSWPDIRVTVDGVECKVRSYSIRKNEAARSFEVSVDCFLYEEKVERARVDREMIDDLGRMVAETA